MCVMVTACVDPSWPHLSLPSSTRPALCWLASSRVWLGETPILLRGKQAFLPAAWLTWSGV